MRHVFFALAVLVGLAVAALAAEEAELLVRVNGHPITRADLERFLLLFPDDVQRAGLPAPASPLELDRREAVREQRALEAMIDQRLLLEEARREYVSAPAVEAALSGYADQEFGRFEERVGSRLQARRLLETFGLGVDEYKELLIEQLLVREFVREKVYEPVRVMPTELRAYYEENRDEFRAPRTVVYRQILLTVIDRADQLRQRARALEVMERLGAGEDFADVADQFSDDRHLYPGGLHRVAVPEELGDWLPPAVSGLRPGSTSGVRQCAGGICIVRLEQVLPERIMPFEEAQGLIKERLLERRRLAAHVDLLERLRQEAQIELSPAGRALAP